MKDKLIPVGSNRLLDRLRVAACHSAEYFLTVACRNVRARITPGITRRALDVMTDKLTMRGLLTRGRVHAVVRCGLTLSLTAHGRRSKCSRSLWIFPLLPSPRYNRQVSYQSRFIFPLSSSPCKAFLFLPAPYRRGASRQQPLSRSQFVRRGHDCSAVTYP